MKLVNLLELADDGSDLQNKIINALRVFHLKTNEYPRTIVLNESELWAPFDKNIFAWKVDAFWTQVVSIVNIFNCVNNYYREVTPGKVLVWGTNRTILFDEVGNWMYSR